MRLLFGFNHYLSFLLLLLLLLTYYDTSFITVVDGADSTDKCAANTQLECPNIQDCPSSGFSYVSDCLDCENNLNTDGETNQCFTRKILNANDNPSSQYLWRDIVGMVVWFCAAGVATACGVGGGGIYVPLGIILLSFAPKPASGLSQASIFGASLGGLLLNSRNTHPFTAKLVTKTNNNQDQADECGGGGGGIGKGGTTTTNNATVTVTKNIPTNDNGEYIDMDDSNINYYTRPLIDYDMALFLAPMEMAGAVLGVLIQKILPNWLYLFIAAVILGFTAKKTYAKWHSTRQKELQEALLVNEERELELNAVNSDEEGLLNQGVSFTKPTDNNNNNNDNEDEIEVTEMMRVSNISAAAPAASSSSPSGLHHRSNAVAGTNVDGPDLKPEAVIASGSTNSDTQGDNTTNNSDDNDVLIIMDDEKIALRIHYLERDSRQYPKEKIIAFGILWIGLTLLTFLKGGKGVESLVGIDCSSPWYGVLLAIQFLWTFGFAAGFAYKITKETDIKQSIQYPYHSQDVLWDFQKTRFYAFYTFGAGVIAGLIGIGGGMVLGPLMLVMGIYPRVSTATTATMIVLTSSSVAILYITSGLVPWQYAITFFCTCFTGALVGKTYIDGYVKKTGKQSVLIFLLATIIALATCGALIIAFLRLNAADWCFAGFNKFCNIDDGTASVSCVPSDEQQRYLLNGGDIDFYNHVVVAVSVAAGSI